MDPAKKLKICEYRKQWVKDNPDKVKAARKRWLEKNKQKELKRNQEYHSENRAKMRPRKRSEYLERTYGITQEVFNEKLKEQDFKCAICKGEDPKSRKNMNNFSVDHDHTTGSVRGLLCTPCNLGIGNLQDSLKVLESAILYLKKHGK